MSIHKEIKNTKKFCDDRSLFGRTASVRDPRDKKGLKNKFIETILQQAFEKEVQLHHTETVLDLGCGSGIFTEILAAKAKNTMGLDVSFQMLKLSNRLPKSPAVYCLYDGVSMPLKTGMFDYVFTREMIHLLSNRLLEKVIRECCRILTPSGKIISAEFGSSNPCRQDGRMGRYERNPASTVQLFEDNGFKCVSYYPIRRGRSIKQYLIRYGFFSEDSIPRLAAREIEHLRTRKNYISRYNADYLFLFHRRD